MSYSIRTGAIFIVIPRSRSNGSRSRYCGRISLASTVCVTSKNRSASVDLPESICAIITKFLMLDILIWERGRENGSFPVADVYIETEGFRGVPINRSDIYMRNDNEVSDILTLFIHKQDKPITT